MLAAEDDRVQVFKHRYVPAYLLSPIKGEAARTLTPQSADSKQIPQADFAST